MTPQTASVNTQQPFHPWKSVAHLNLALHPLLNPLPLYCILSHPTTKQFFVTKTSDSCPNIYLKLECESGWRRRIPLLRLRRLVSVAAMHQWVVLHQGGCGVVLINWSKMHALFMLLLVNPYELSPAPFFNLTIIATGIGEVKHRGLRCSCWKCKRSTLACLSHFDRTRTWVAFLPELRRSFSSTDGVVCFLLKYI